MKILIAAVVSAIATALVGVCLMELASIPNLGVLTGLVYLTIISLGCVAAPATALHFFLRKKNKEPYLVYAVVAALGVATFFLLQQYIMRYSSDSGNVFSHLIVLMTAGFAGGLVYRASLALCNRPEKTAS